jgi:hypothetical protein
VLGFPFGRLLYRVRPHYLNTGRRLFVTAALVKFL